MSMLDTLLGTSDRREIDDFVQRYDNGPPWEGVSDQEAVTHYQQVATQLPAQDYRQAAQEAFSRLTPEQRAQLGQYLQAQASQHGVQIPSFQAGTSAQAWQDPGQLAQATTQLYEQQPDLLGQLLGGPASGQGGQLGNILSSPIAKAALAGIAAIAVKQLQSRQGR